MASEVLHLELSGVAEQIARFEAMQARAQNLSPVWDVVHHAFAHEMADQFMSQGAYINGEEWAPLNPDYAKRKLKFFNPPAPFGILYRTGRLFESLATESGEHVYEPSAQAVTMGTTVPYGKYHQTGTEHLPKRKIIGLRNRFAQLVFRATVRWIVGGTVATADGEG